MPSEPTVAFGYRPTPQDEPSFGSAPTMVPGGASSPSAPPSLGRIDQYELIRKLGGGGFGVVYLARDTVSGIDVALKTLHPLMKSNAEEMERLREKFALVSRLSHPNIASALVLHPVREVMINDAAVWHELRLSPGDSVMVMRYAPGITLSKWRRQFSDGVVPMDMALEVGRQIAAALDYAHGERIVHRDIKPANVMVETLPSEASQPRSNSQKVSSSNSPSADHPPTIRPSDHQTIRPPDHQTIGPLDHPTKIRVRILDFGLAAEIRSSMSRVSTEIGDTSGTRPYMAPEQWLGKKQDGRTDQYALACVLYELLSGEPPFAGVFETGDQAIMMQAVKSESPDEIDGTSPAVNAALLKALAKNPKERFASCAELVAAIKGRASSPSEPQKKSGKGWLVAALLALVVGGGIWCALHRNGRASSPSEPPPVETRVPSSATQDGAAEYERRIAEERKAREEAERKAEEAERREREGTGGVPISVLVENGKATVRGKDEWSPAVPQDTCGEVRIPARIGGTKVSKIGSRAFANCSHVSSIILSKGLEEIGNGAFSECDGLSSIVIPDGVKSIGKYAFSDCDGLTEIVLPGSLESIGENAFSDCPNLISVVLPDSVTEIGSDAFEDCKRLENVKLPARLSALPSRMFKGCEALSSVSIPYGVREIGYYSFSGCSGLTSISIPSNVVKIGEGAFYHSGLASVTLPKTLQSVGAGAFSGSELRTAKLEEGVSTVWNGLFSGCDKLERVELSGTVVTIGNSVFYGCSSLSSISLPESVKTIGRSAFQNCDALSSFAIPTGVTTIPDYAFDDCDVLASVTIPDGVQRIGENAFSDCPNLISVVLPDSVTEIGSDAFEDCSSLTSLVVPDDVRKIGGRAFRGAALSSLTIPARFKSQLNQFGIRNGCKIVYSEDARKEEEAHKVEETRKAKTDAERRAEEAMSKAEKEAKEKARAEAKAVEKKARVEAEARAKAEEAARREREEKDAAEEVERERLEAELRKREAAQMSADIIVTPIANEKNVNNAIGNKTTVVIETNLGSIEVELNAEKAPATVANFLSYVDESFYDGTIFHRVIPYFMIQGGGFTQDMSQKETKAPIKNEAANGLKNVRGTIAMARTMVVNSATTQFFINTVDNAFLDFRAPTPQGFGYAVFGRVTSGMEVVDAISAAKTGVRNGMRDVPLDTVVIKTIRRK